MMSSTSVEGYLTRELDIRFIDARSIANEAKIFLGISGYPSKEEYQLVRLQATRIFHQRPESERATMRRMNSDLEAVKAVHNVRTSGTSLDGYSTDGAGGSSVEESSSTTSSSKRSTKRGWLQRTFSSGGDQ